MTLPCSQPDPLALAGRHLHFVGIGGCGMSGLARIACQLGATCSGSDMADSSAIAQLRNDGFDVTLKQTAQSVPDDTDMLIVSAAIHDDHAEVVTARQREIQIVKYAQLLGRLMVGRLGVAVAGTHGKSSTTSLLSHVLIQCGLDPSCIVGATCKQIGGGARSGGSDLLVAEACEYDRSFHHFYPTHAVILNVEEDHLDLYKNLDEIVEAFGLFATRVPRHGTLLIHHEMAHRLPITAGLDCNIETIGFAPQADWHVDVDSHATVTRLHHNGKPVTQWSPPLPGEHMAYNAAAAAVTAHRLGADWEPIAQAIADFEGLDRRMQMLGQREGVTLIDDYGHHPTEIDTTLRALRTHYKPKRLICVFQPHQHSRTRFLMEQFAASFSQADIVLVPHIYFVRDSEQDRLAVNAGDLVDQLRRRGKQAMHLYPFEAIVEQLEMIMRDGDLVVTMGAGDVWKISHALLK